MTLKVYAASLLLFAFGTARADFFQIVEPQQGFLAAHSPVYDRDGQLLGQTDLYGRIAIHHLPYGTYEATVMYYDQPRRVVFSIDGDMSYVKTIYLQ